MDEGHWRSCCTSAVQWPQIIGTVGRKLQFEVIQYRLENEYSAKCRWEPSASTKPVGRGDDAAELGIQKRKYQYMAKDREAGMCSWPIADMCFRWLKWTSNMLKFHRAVLIAFMTLKSHSSLLNADYKDPQKYGNPCSEKDL